jgi:hypothetical protein
MFHNKAPLPKYLNQIRRRGVGLAVGSVNWVNEYKRRRGLVRFRKPDSRAAHCREFYDLDFRMAQAKIFEVSALVQN